MKPLSYLKILSLWLVLVSTSGCYTLKSAYHQMSLLNSREDYEDVLKRPDLKLEQKNKILFAQEVLRFAENDLGLNSNGNYSKIVMLNRSYVTYVVSAAEPWSLKSYDWYFPIVGNVPYLGFFSEDEALEEEKELKKKGLDTYQRGVSAYSTLGWFRDPLLSSMLRYDDHTLAETLIHELIHTTFWVKNSAEFNERLASFLGRKGAQIFYQNKEGSTSATSQLITDEAFDEKLFSEFITLEVKLLDQWYKELKKENRSFEAKESRIKEIQSKFESTVLKKMKTDSWSRFSHMKLNNARLVMYRTYLSDFSAFEKLWALTQQNIKAFLKACEPLKNSKDPDKELQKIIAQLQLQN